MVFRRALSGGYGELQVTSFVARKLRGVRGEFIVIFLQKGFQAISNTQLGSNIDLWSRELFDDVKDEEENEIGDELLPEGHATRKGSLMTNIDFLAFIMPHTR